MPSPEHGLYLKLIFCLWLVHGFSSPPALAEQESLWTPVDPPKSHYTVDARVDILKGVLEGKETVEFKNTSAGRISLIAFDWSIGPKSFLSVSSSGKPLSPLNPEKANMLPAPVFFRLAEPLGTGKKSQA